MPRFVLFLIFTFIWHFPDVPFYATAPIVHVAFAFCHWISRPKANLHKTESFHSKISFPRSLSRKFSRVVMKFECVKSTFSSISTHTSQADFRNMLNLNGLCTFTWLNAWWHGLYFLWYFFPCSNRSLWMFISSSHQLLNKGQGRSNL